MFGRVLCSGARVRCARILRPSCPDADTASGHVTFRNHVCEALLGYGTDSNRFHTHAPSRNSGDKPLQPDEEGDAEGPKSGKLDPTKWENIVTGYVHGHTPKAADNANRTLTADGTEQDDGRDYDLEKLLANISVLKSAERIQEEAGGAERPRRTSAMTIAELVEFLRGENAQDICVINVPPERQYVQYFVTCSGKGPRHISKIAHSLVDEVKGVVPKRRRNVHVEGSDSDDWMVVDLGDMVVHFMLPAARNHYQLEKLWTLGPRYDDQFQAVLREVTEDRPVTTPLPTQKKYNNSLV